MKTMKIDDIFTKGKWKDYSVAEVMNNDLYYILTCYIFNRFKFDDKIIKELKERYDNFDIEYEFDWSATSYDDRIH